MKDVDFTHPTLDGVLRLEEKIKNGYPKLITDKFVINHNMKTIIRKDKENDTERIVYTVAQPNVFVCISDNSFANYNRVTNELFVRGWCTPRYGYDKISVWIDKTCLGNSTLDISREDVYLNRNDCDTYKCGWEFKKKVPEISKDSIARITCEKQGRLISEKQFSIRFL